MEPAEQKTDFNVDNAVAVVFEEAERQNRAIRCTRDDDDKIELLSVLDAAATLTGDDQNHIARKIRELPDEVNQKMVNHKFPGRGQRNTPVATPSNLISILLVLPNPNNRYPLLTKLRDFCCKTTVRSIGGDPILAQSILARNDAFESGAVPRDHPLQAFRREGAELGAKSAGSDSDATTIASLASMITSLSQNMNKLVETNQQLAISNQTLATQVQAITERLATVATTRVLPPADDGKSPVFVLYETHATLVPRISYPYYIMKCMKENEASNEARLRRKYPRITRMLRIEHPNANALYQVLKERAPELGVEFYRSEFATVDGAHIDELTQFIREHESARRMETGGATALRAHTQMPPYCL